MLVVAAGGMVGCTHEAPPNPAAEDGKKTPAVDFTDVTNRVGLDAFNHETGAFGKKWLPETMGPGVGFVDYNSDGWLDVVFVGGGVWPETDRIAPPALALYRNEGDGTFTNATEEAGLSDTHAYGMGIVASDYDNDGDQDIYLTTLHRNRLFRNDDGVFREVGNEAGVAGSDTWSTTAVFFDADRDGHLDLYVGNYIKWSPDNDLFCSLDGETKAYCTPEEYEGATAHFYHNDGDGSFSDWTERASFLPAPGKTLGATTLDYNSDGWPDLIVANDQERNLLYENQGDGTFEERGIISAIAFNEEGRARAGMGVDAGVVDSTGEPTIFVGNFSREMIGVYRHAGGGLFVDRAASSKIGYPSLSTLTFGLSLFDVDLDTDLDLLAANGHLQQQVEEVQDGIAYREPPQLFLNKGAGTFEKAKSERKTPLAEPLVARGAAYGDYDCDGDQDVLIGENGGSVHLWRNEVREKGPSTRHFLRVLLRGRASNRDAVGSRVVAVVGEERMERRVRAGSSYLSVSEQAVTFGLANAEQVDTLRVYWPSGKTSQFEGVEADQSVRIVEGSGQLQRLVPTQKEIVER
jgi:hypothetical protein